MFSASDFQYMARAIQLAKQPVQSPHPNPRVGCVIVKDGKVLGEGFHNRAGEPHAEIMALQNAAQSIEDATVYVTLEPCSHTGKTPPCALALIEAKVGRVVAAMQDPNPQVAGSGLKMLQQKGIDCNTGLLEEQARELNPGFIKRMQCGMPWVRTKIAMSVDGRTALANGESQWITGTSARKDVQSWRAKADAILSGSGTVLIDNPRLTIRDIDCDTIRQPLRVIVDSQLKIPNSAEIFQQSGQVLLANLEQSDSSSYKNNVRCLKVSEKDNHVDLRALLVHLGREEINEVHVEAGPILNGVLFKENLIDEIIIYMAPTIMGDKSKGIFGLPELTSMQQKFALQCKDVRQVGEDIRFIYHRVH